jgi:hypothetical protein
MRRNTSNWIARIFAVAAAAATPTLAGCGSNDTVQEPDQSAPVSTDMSVPIDLANEDDFGPSIRRPFLVGSSLRAAAPAVRDDWQEHFTDTDFVDPTLRAALAAAWLKDALEEHASVAAFARFSIMGLAVGAPPDIIADGQRASLDEIRHAKICFGLARRYGASEAGPGPLLVDGALGSLDLVGLAKLTAEEGCVGETLGALLAERQAQVATDALVKDALVRIARDERRHAELAWRFIAWASRTGGAEVIDEVSKSIASAVAATRATILRPLLVDATLWHAHGRLSCTESRDIGEEAIQTIVLPALARLQGRVPEEDAA